MTHLVHRRPEPHAVDPRRRVGVARRRLRDERVDEQRGALPVVRTDVVEHDPAQARPGLVERGVEDPHRPLRRVREARPVDLHRIVHLHVRPGRPGRSWDLAAGVRSHLAARPPDDLRDRQRLAGQRGRPVRVGARVDLRVGDLTLLEVELEIDRAEVLGAELVDDRALCRAAARELDLQPAAGREVAAESRDLDLRVREGRGRAVLVPDRSLPPVRADLGQSGDPVDPSDEKPADRPADRHLRVAAVDVETDLLLADRTDALRRGPERNRDLLRNVDRAYSPLTGEWIGASESLGLGELTSASASPSASSE